MSLVEMRDDGGVGRLTPHCKIHGAMNRVSADGFWRCISTSYEMGVWYESDEIGKDGKPKMRTKLVSGNPCRAGCIIEGAVR